MRVRVLGRHRRRSHGSRSGGAHSVYASQIYLMVWKATTATEHEGLAMLNSLQERNARSQGLKGTRHRHGMLGNLSHPGKSL